MGGWMQQCAGLLDPLYRELKDFVWASKVVGTDDTPVKVLDRNLPQTRKGVGERSCIGRNMVTQHRWASEKTSQWATAAGRIGVGPAHGWTCQCENHQRLWSPARRNQCRKSEKILYKHDYEVGYVRGFGNL